MNDLQVVLVVHKAIIKKVHVASGEDYDGFLTAVVFLSSTPMMLHFESQPTLDTGLCYHWWYLQVALCLLYC